MTSTETISKALDVVLDQVRGEKNSPWPAQHPAKPASKSGVQKDEVLVCLF